LRITPAPEVISVDSLRVEYVLGRIEQHFNASTIPST
jgi:hypothetical protein